MKSTFCRMYTPIVLGYVVDQGPEPRISGCNARYSPLAQMHNGH